MRDRRGITKQRPAVILTATNDIRTDEPFTAIAVTTSFPQPPPDDHIPLPWHPQGRAGTKLYKRSAAVLSWIVEVAPNDVEEFGGDVPAAIMFEIFERLAEDEE